MKMRSLGALAGVTALGLVASLAGQSPANSQGPDKFIIVQSTTSTENSGLFKHILPMFTEKTGIEVRVVAVAPARPSRTRSTAMATWCSCTTSRRRRSSSPRASA